MGLEHYNCALPCFVDLGYVLTVLRTVGLVGGTKKRKAGKVIGDDDEENKAPETAEKNESTATKVVKKAKKKAKPIKLAFDDE